MKFKTQIVTLAILLTSSTARAIEEPAFQVISSEGNFSIREYAPFVSIETEVQGGFKGASNEGFRRLAAYIFGKNVSSQEISMTAPVATSKTGDETWRVTFVLPATYTLATAPRPLDDRVIVKEVSAQRIAVLRYSGMWSQDRFEEKKVELLEWMSNQKIEPTGSATLARFNPPWTPWFLRRNEVWIPVGGLE